MPVSWIPRKHTIQELITEELARIEALKAEQVQPIVAPTQWQPEVSKWIPPTEEPTIQIQPQTWMPTTAQPQIQTIAQPQIAPLIPSVTLPKPEVKPYELPKVWTEAAMGKVGEVISKVPVLPEVLKWAAPAFEFIHEKLELPFASFITAPFSPTLSWKSGESWLEHEKREYDAWKAPTYVKGLAEFAMPLWWMPWFGWVAKSGKTLIGGGKAAKMAALIDPNIPAKALFPTYTQLEQFIPNNLFKQVALKTEHIPILGRMVKVVGGEAAFTRRNPLTVADKAKNYAVFQGIHRDMGENLVRIQMNDLPLARIITKGGKQTFKAEDDLLKLYDIETIAGQRLNAKVGGVTLKPEFAKELKGSTFIDDVFQNPNAYEWADTAAFEYIKAGHGVVNWFMEWAKANGVAIPSAKRGIKVVGEMIQEHIPRMAKGATSPEGLFAPFKRTDPFMEMVHDLMVEGVEAGVKYGGSFADRVALMSGAITRRVAAKKFDDAVRPLGKTLLERLEALEPEVVGRLGMQANRVDVLSKALLSLQKGKPLHYATMGRLQQEIPDLARVIADVTSVRGAEAANFIRGMSKSSQLIIEKNRKPLIEALLAQPQRTTFYDTIATVTKFAKSEQVAVRVVERFYRQQIKAKTAEFRNLIRQTGDVLVNEKGVLAPLKAEVSKLKRQLKIPKEEMFEAKFRVHPAFNKRIFPAEVVRTLEPLLTDRGNQWVRNMAQVSGLSRMMVAALDLSAPFIQGLMVFGRNPIAWGKSVFKMLQVAKTPWKLHLELGARKASRMERVLYGGSTASIDYFEAMPVLRRIVGKVPKGERAVAETYGRAEAAFLGFGEIARDEMWKAGKFMIGKKGLAEVAQQEQMRELARSLDRMTGVMSPQALGIGLSQQQVESAWVFFAPRYTRAGLSFIGDMMRGGFAGAEARKALAGLALGGTTMYMGICSALGQQPYLDPRSARFMTVKIGDTHIGVGGIYYAVLRTMADVAATAVEEPGQLSPLNFSRTDNPFYKFMYSRTAPLTGLTFGLAIEQKNYFGEPFENIGDYAAFMADKVLPIAVQSVMPWERKPWQDSAFDPAKLAVEFGGMRAFPESAWEARDIYQDNLALELHRKKWGDLTRAEQREIEADNPVLIKFDEEIARWNLQRGEPENILFNRWQDEIDVNKEDRDERIRNVASAALQDKNYYQFRLRIEDIENDYGAILQHINSNKEYADIMARLGEPKTAEQLSKMQYLDAAYNMWASYRFSQTETPWGKMVNELGEPIWENVERFRVWFRTQFGEEALNYVEQERPLAGRDLPELYLELRKAKQVLKPYWQVKEEAVRIYGEPKTQYQLTKLNSFVQRIHQRLRRTNPEIAEAYAKFYTRPAEF